MPPEAEDPVPSQREEETSPEREYRPPWRMVKQRILKEDGRYLIYYRFLPLPEEEAREE